MLTLRITGNNFEELKHNVALLDRELNQVVSQQIPMNFPKENPSTRTASESVAPQPVAAPIPRVEQPTQVEPIRNPTPQPLAAPQLEVGGERDAAGFPWDNRIHSTSKEKTKKGCWRYRRGVEDSLILQVEAQLRGLLPQAVPMAQPIPTPIPQAAPIPQIPAVPPTTVVVQTPVFQQPPPMPSQFVGQPVTAAPVETPEQAKAQYDNFSSARRQAHDFASFKATFAASLTKLITDGKITPEYLNLVKSHCKVTEIWDLNDQQKLELFENLAQAGIINKVGA